MKYFYITLFFLIVFAQAYGQTGSLEGRVLDSNKSPLPGATLVLAGTRVGTQSDALGNFKIANLAAGNYDAVISFVGFETQHEKISIEAGKKTLIASALQSGSLQLADVTVSDSKEKNLTSISAIDIKLRPVNTSQDVLRMIPGLFIAQHAGGGKAEQIFLRGFDLDHGTDINLSVDGMPVNMVSHAHGQGYADLHFVIPETIESVDFNKGPYCADKGNFTTAGYAAFKTKTTLGRNQIKFETGQFGLARGMAMINLLNKKSETKNFKQSAYVASEFSHTNSFFEHTQDFRRLNAMAKYTAWWNEKNMITATVSTFDSKWNASGQIPDRAVDNKMITRFGSIDPTEGGNTSRTNATIKHIRTLKNGGLIENQVYFTKYDFSLYSNFTFFLKDSIHGDQINQSEGRKIFGYNGSYTQQSFIGGRKLETQIGGALRRDNADNVRLAHTVKRQYLGNFKWGNVRETNASVFISETLDLTPRLSVNAAVRYDQFIFEYDDKLIPQKRSATKGIISPKLNFNYKLNSETSLYLKMGQGFHSNDTRVSVATNGKDILPKATGADLGALFKPSPNVLINAALWVLDLRQEFVYVGDDAIIEPSGKTFRKGVDVSVRYQMYQWLYADMDLSYTHPRSTESPEGKNYIPLAPLFTSIGGLSFRKGNGLNGSMRYRYMAARPANEDYSITAKGYFIMDAIVNYTKPKYEIGLSAENIFDTQWKEAQFATTSRLKNETVPVKEIHFTPGTPFFLKARVSFFF